MKSLAVDIDEVFCLVNESVILPEINKVIGSSYALEDITEFDYDKCLEVGAKAIAFEVFNRFNLYDSLTPADGALTVLEDLRRNDWDIFALSSPFTGHMKSKWEFCRRFGFSHNDICITGGKHRIRFDLIIEDRPNAIKEYAPNVIIYDRPWNRSENPPSFARVKNWLEIGELLCP